MSVQEEILPLPVPTAPAAAHNPLFPVFIKLETLQVLVVGGGFVGLEKLSAIYANSPATQVTLVAPEIRPEVYELATQYPGLVLIQREFWPQDLDGKDLVLIATNFIEVNKEIRSLARARKILCNVADTPNQCDFYLGSIVQKGSLKLAISTNGKSPTLAKRVKETLNDVFPDEVETILDNLGKIRNTLKGDFAEKVRTLNEITKVMASTGGEHTAPVSVPTLVAPTSPTSAKSNKYSIKNILLFTLAALSLMVTGHILFSYIPLETIGGLAWDAVEQIDSTILIFIVGGFVAQLIDGALGMAYGVSATTFLLSFGISPVAASASVHASEIFTSGVSGLMHLKFGNVNSKLFKNIVIPGVIGAIIGAYLLYNLEEYIYIIKPIVAAYTLFLGILIIRKVFAKRIKKQPVKKVGWLATLGGFMDAIGGGGWGPIVSSTLIAKGRHPMYTIGSVNLAEFFVSVASSVTFITLAGFSHWKIILGLVIGGMISAPIGAHLARKLPVKTMMLIVGILVIIVSLRIIYTIVV
jgi:uncharacterized protein